MIEKIISIKNVGRFENYSASGDVSLKKVSVIFSDNARGKTTLASILRSLCCDAPPLIQERKTLGGTKDPEVKIKLESELATYESQAWSCSYPHLLIFDSLFVDENVYSGLTIQHGHKRNLYEFIVGEQGVQKATRIGQIDTETRKISGEISNIEKLLKRILPQGVDIKTFLAIGEDPEIDKKTAAKMQEVNELENAEAIEKTPKLEKLVLPTFDLASVTSLLSKTLADVSEHALTKTREHIATHLDEEGEGWIRRGLGYVTEDEMCPFCGQSLDGVDLINCYRAFFNENYGLHKKGISESYKAVSNSLAQTHTIQLQQVLLNNQRYFDFWKDHIEFLLPDSELNVASERLDALREASLAVLSKKEASPLEDIPLTTELTSALEEYQDASGTVEIYNKEIDKLNALVEEKKESTKAGDLNKAKEELILLQVVSIRQEDEVKELCESYKTLVGDKETLTQEKTHLKSDLDSLTQAILGKYQASLNNYLEKFGADFKIVEANSSYIGGRPSAVYLLSINNQNIELGDENTPPGEPCFKNTLSDGDRRTLAFAFFLAKIVQDPDIGNKCVVFDDPVSSFDRHRKSHAVQEILNVASQAKQVMALSHDPFFCYDILQRADKSDGKALKIERKGASNSTIAEWNAESDIRSQYFNDYYKLKDYLERGGSGDLPSIASKIRPLLEGNLRSRFPDRFPSGKWLGEMIEMIRNADSSSPLSRLHGQQLQELEEINEFSKKFHHDTKPSGYDPSTLTDGELTSYVRRTLEFVPGV